MHNKIPYSRYLTSLNVDVKLIAFKFLIELAERCTQIIDRDESLRFCPINNNSFFLFHRLVVRILIGISHRPDWVV